MRWSKTSPNWYAEHMPTNIHINLHQYSQDTNNTFGKWMDINWSQSINIILYIYIGIGILWTITELYITPFVIISHMKDFQEYTDWEFLSQYTTANSSWAVKRFRYYLKHSDIFETKYVYTRSLFSFGALYKNIDCPTSKIHLFYYGRKNDIKTYFDVLFKKRAGVFY
jgi:hypothetical protein